MDKIELSGSMVANLYKDLLVASPGTQPKKSESDPPKKEAPENPPIPGLQFTGNNQRKLSLIISSEMPEIGNSQLAFLTNILKACKLTLNDVAILAFPAQEFSIKEIKEELSPRELILFGINPVQISIPINFPQFKIQSYDTINYLYVPAIEEINQDTENGKLLKSKLWICLKQMFHI